MDDHKPLDPRQILVEKDIRDNRYKICQDCNNLNNLKVCTKCFCFMPAKTWLKKYSCPIKKW